MTRCPFFERSVAKVEPAGPPPQTTASTWSGSEAVRNGRSALTWASLMMVLRVLQERFVDAARSDDFFQGRRPHRARDQLFRHRVRSANGRRPISRALLRSKLDGICD